MVKDFFDERGTAKTGVKDIARRDRAGCRPERTSGGRRGDDGRHGGSGNLAGCDGLLLLRRTLARARVFRARPA